MTLRVLASSLLVGFRNAFLPEAAWNAVFLVFGTASLRFVEYPFLLLLSLLACCTLRFVISFIVSLELLHVVLMLFIGNSFVLFVFWFRARSFSVKSVVRLTVTGSRFLSWLSSVS